jgi:TPR repeat protein
VRQKRYVSAALLVAALAFAGCATFRLDSRSVAMSGWLNRSLADLRQAWGPPQSTGSDGKGGQRWVYQGSRVVTTEASSYELDGVTYDSPATSSNFYYHNEFLADPQGSIYGWKWSNSDGSVDDLDGYVANVRYHAEQGDASAARWLGFWYGLGSNGLPQDYAKAIQWDRLAADHGLDDAENNLGICYWKAPGATDYAKAFVWFKKSAAQGYSEGEFDLGRCYQEGKGAAVDLKQAARWFHQAAVQGNDAAKQALAEIESTLDR